MLQFPVLNFGVFFANFVCECFGFCVSEFLLSMLFKLIVLFYIFIITKDAPPPKYVPFYGLIKNI